MNSLPRGTIIDKNNKNNKISLKYKEKLVKSEYAPVWNAELVKKTCLIGKNRLKIKSTNNNFTSL